jgi:hypothetical protein
VKYYFFVFGLFVFWFVLLSFVLKLIFLLKLLAIVFHIVLYCSVVQTNISPRLIDGKITINMWNIKFLFFGLFVFCFVLLCFVFVLCFLFCFCVYFLVSNLFIRYVTMSPTPREITHWRTVSFPNIQQRQRQIRCWL